MNIDDRMAFGAPTEAEAIAYEYDRIRSIERQFVVAFLIAIDPDEWDPEDVARAISDGDHLR